MAAQEFDIHLQCSASSTLNSDLCRSKRALPRFAEMTASALRSYAQIGNSIDKTAYLFNDKVSLDALKGLVGLLLQHKDDITRQDTRLAVACLPSENYLGIVLVALLNVHLKDLLLWKEPLQHNMQALHSDYSALLLLISHDSCCRTSGHDVLPRLGRQAVCR